jgi:hypothetical protein
VFDETKSPEPPYPSLKAAEAEFTAVAQLEGKEKIDDKVWHAPPG